MELLETDEVTRTLIGCPPTAERQNRIRSYCYGTAVTAQRQAATATAQRNFSRKHKQRNSYGAAYVILTECTYGNGETATAELYMGPINFLTQPDPTHVHL